MSTVVIACRIPLGLQICGVIVAGPLKIKPELLVNGYALTGNVDEEEWNDWLKANRKSEMVQKGLVFAAKNIDEVRHLSYMNRKKSEHAFQLPFR